MTSSIPATQLVGVYHGPRDIRLETRPVPRPGPDEALIRITATALCAGEAMDWYSARPGGKVLGHEAVGVVAAVGPTASGVAVGDRVFVNHHVGSLRSPQALRGHFTIDPAYRSTRLDPGAMASYARVSAAHLATDTRLVPPSIPDDVATTIEPWSCVLGGLKTCGIQPGDTVLVLGGGFMGLGFAHMAPLFGAGRVLVSDYSAWRRGKALALGASQAINAGGDVPAQVRAANGGRLADVVVAAVPAAAVFAQARSLVEAGGTIHLAAPGRPGDTWGQDAAEAYFSEVAITSKYSADHRDTFQYLRLLEAGRVDPSPAITHHFPLSQLPEAFRLLQAADESLKIVLYPPTELG
ncbi:MAG: alcohol dehydrogenase catalytic domain-containing protein [Bifidobacteriaceae bacterium]|jgi:L-iditol 2-dehydrogenase|nr:alcohol dehydrogenase catalytic domain-containing protein [Bifidobacteriaceae bacterium]